MSTENNLEDIYNNSIRILKDLIAFKTVAGEDNNQLIDCLLYTSPSPRD